MKARKALHVRGAPLHGSYLQLMLLHKPLPALAALVRFDPSMNSFMDVLLLVRGESLIAERAWVLKKNAK